MRRSTIIWFKISYNRIPLIETRLIIVYRLLVLGVFYEIFSLENLGFHKTKLLQKD